MVISRRNFIDHTLLLIVIAISGIPYFTTSALLLPVAFILLMFFYMRNKKIDRVFYLLIVFLIIITVLQTFVFNFISLQTTVGLFLRILIGYLVIKLLSERFTDYYVNILYFFSIAGIILFILTALPGIDSLFISLLPLFSIFNIADSVHETLIIYNMGHIEHFRNSGPFWEPGAFAGYIMIAIIFLHFNSDIYNKKRKLFFLILALITTLSTTGFIAIVFFLFFYYYKDIKNVVFKITIAVVLLYGSYYAYTSLDFLGDKIEHQLSMAAGVEAYGTNVDTQRFLNILRDFEDFKGHELVGRGSNPLTRYSYMPEEQIRTVGLTDIIVKNGLPFFLLMMYFLYRSMCYIVFNKNIKKDSWNCYVSFFTTLIVLMSEVYFNFPLFWAFLFIFTISKKGKSIDLYSNPGI
jgi:hypothetical protein